MLNNNLRIFYYVAEMESITKAAETLYISAPAVSQSVKALESKLDTQLFIRTRRSGLKLTSVGKELFRIAGQMLSLEEQLYQIVKSEVGLLSGTVKIGSVPATTGPLLAIPIAVFHRLYPSVRIEIREGTPDEIIQMIENGIVDFALTANPFGNVACETLLYDEIVAIRPPESRYTGTVCLQDDMEGMIMTTACAETLAEQTKQHTHFNFHRNYLVQETDAVIQLVTAGLGIGIASRWALEAIQCELDICPVTPHIVIEIGVSTLNFDTMSPAATEFLRILRKGFQTQEQL